MKRPPQRGTRNAERGTSEYHPVQSLAELEALCNVPVKVECHVGGKLVTFSGRRLVRAERERIRELLEQALPPLLPGSEKDMEEGPRYDLRNPEYQRTKRDLEFHARSLALYWCFPLFRNLVPGEPPAEDDIVAAFKASKLDEELLDYAYALLTAPLVGVDMRRVGFTSGSSSPAS